MNRKQFCIDCVSDLHGYEPIVKGAQFLVIGGDHTANDNSKNIDKFCKWVEKAAANYDHVIYIGGNHDEQLYRAYKDGYPHLKSVKNVHYLKDAAIELEGVKFYGSPWSPHFEGINPQCTAFVLNDDKLKAKWKKIPADTEVLITHTPPYGILDTSKKGIHCGSYSLNRRLLDGVDRKEKINPAIHIFGHIHEEGNSDMAIGFTRYVNCSFVDEHYRKRDGFAYL